MVIFREFLQNSFLILDRVRIALYPIILAETAVQGGFPDLVLLIHTVLLFFVKPFRALRHHNTPNGLKCPALYAHSFRC